MRASEGRNTSWAMRARRAVSWSAAWPSAAGVAIGGLVQRLLRLGEVEERGAPLGGASAEAVAEAGPPPQGPERLRVGLQRPVDRLSALAGADNGQSRIRAAAGSRQTFAAASAN